MNGLYHGVIRMGMGPLSKSKIIRRDSEYLEREPFKKR